MPSADVICRAIAERRLIGFFYKGERRSVAPHILGFDEAGRLLLSAVQRVGGSGVGFRTYHVDEIGTVEVDTRRFTPSGDYNPRDPVFERVLYQV